ncbi:hypothetical protein [Pseudanabaena sp. 'Roaring Creek']|uniref:hypothetical protein n=1 Tax=Pseudanabaena sp. 'Roaring Creek' TaxID=1681830 RepID=UPI0006D7DE33|nr:hypothetical protein [Pseudanabaena sp. 'Roaring Creek']
MQTIEKYRHLSSKTLFAVDRWNKDKTIVKTHAGAVFSISDCEKWNPEYPQIAFELPPQDGEVVMRSEHVFIVVKKSRDGNTKEPRLWYGNVPGQFYPISECSLVSDDLINAWANEIAKFRNHKETSAEYQNFIQQVPEAIRDLCVIKSLNYLYELKEPIVVNKNGFF